MKTAKLTPTAGIDNTWVLMVSNSYTYSEGGRNVRCYTSPRSQTFTGSVAGLALYKQAIRKDRGRIESCTLQPPQLAAVAAC